MLTVESLPECDHDGLGQRLARLRGQLPGELVRLVTLDAQQTSAIHLVADEISTANPGADCG